MKNSFLLTTQTDETFTNYLYGEENTKGFVEDNLGDYLECSVQWAKDLKTILIHTDLTEEKVNEVIEQRGWEFIVNPLIS